MQPQLDGVKQITLEGIYLVMKNICVKTLLVVAAFLLSADAFAGGFKIPDQSTRAMGMIDAFVAGADDASAIYYNPAGLMQLRDPEIISNLYFAHSTMRADGPDFDETSDSRIYAVPSLYAATPFAEDFALGIGIYSPFGLGSRWGDTDESAEFGSLGEIKLVNINPTVAWRLTDKLSLGFGVDFFKSRVVFRTVDPNLGEVDLDVEGDGWGYNAGLQWQASETVAFGLTYRSKVEVHHEGDLDIDGQPGMPIPGVVPFRGSADAELEFPESVTGAVAWWPSENLRIEFAAEYSDWSSMDAQVIYHDFPLMPNPKTNEKNWKDSWVLMLGAEYFMNEKWTLRAGYGYNETPVPKETADPTLPQGDTHAFSLGAGYKVNDSVTLDVGALVSYGTEQTLNNQSAPQNTEYDAIATFLSFGLRYQFN